MFDTIKDITHKFLSFVKDDPVRPEIDSNFRVQDGRYIAVLHEDGLKPDAMVCVSFHDFIPATTKDLEILTKCPTTAVFYTIWSYKPGKGQELLFKTVDDIRKNIPDINRFVTLSPKTDLARKFHLRNGAVIYRENEETVNYEYR